MSMLNPDATKTEHRDALLAELLKITQFNCLMPIPAYLRRDPSLFFETFEHFKNKPPATAVAAPAILLAPPAEVAAAGVVVPDFIKATSTTSPTYKETHTQTNELSHNLIRLSHASTVLQAHMMSSITFPSHTFMQPPQSHFCIPDP